MQEFRSWGVKADQREPERHLRCFRYNVIFSTYYNRYNKFWDHFDDIQPDEGAGED